MPLDAVIKPLLLINTVGTLTPVKLPSPAIEWGSAHIWNQRVPIHMKLRKWLSVILEEFELVWCTDWPEEMVRDLEVNLGFAGYQQCITAPDEARLDVVKQWLADTGNYRMNLVWMDHSLPDAVFDWASGREGRTMIIRPDAIGLEERHVSLLELFAISPDLVRSDDKLSLWTP